MEVSVRHAVVALVLAALGGAAAAADPADWQRDGWTKTDFTRTRIAWSEIVSGGPPKDGIPAIDAPQFKPVAEIADLDAKEPVIGLEIAGEARAYPLRVLIWHEIVNDRISGRPVTVTYCPLCNSAIVFDRRVGERVLDFGTTGKLRKSDLVMYDRQTESWWQQFTGEAIAGEMTGTELKMLPARLESFAEFKARNPAGQVLVPADANKRPYGMSPYAGYDSSHQPFLYRGDMPFGIEAMARVVVVRRDGEKPLIVALDHLRKRAPLDIGVVRFAWRAGQTSAVDQPEIAKGRDVGTVTVQRLEAGQPAAALAYDVTFAFVAHAFHPDVPILKD